MALHPDTITAILNNWAAPKYDGSQDVRRWLTAIEKLCQIYGIPPIQMTEIVVQCTTGLANPVLTAIFKAKVADTGLWSWTDFKEFVIRIEDNYRQNMKDAPRDIRHEDFHSKRSYVAAVLAVALVGVGSTVVLPAVTSGTIGLGAGVAAVACLQSAIVAPPLLTAFAGLGTAVGVWLG